MRIKFCFSIYPWNAQGQDEEEGSDGDDESSVQIPLSVSVGDGLEHAVKLVAKHDHVGNAAAVRVQNDESRAHHSKLGAADFSDGVFVGPSGRLTSPLSHKMQSKQGESDNKDLHPKPRLPTV